MKKFQGTWPLTNENIDFISTNLQEYLQDSKVDKKETMRLRLSVEDVLLQWQNQLGEEALCSVILGRRLWRPYVQLKVKGKQINPYEISDPDFGDGSAGNAMLAALGLKPSYNYVDGSNLLTLRPAKKKINPMIPVFLAIILALVIGHICGTVLDPESQKVLVSAYLKPLFGTFMHILSMVAGLIVFFSILEGIVSIGDIAFLGTVGKRLVSRLFLWIYGSLVVTLLLAIWFYPLDLGSSLSAAGIGEQVWKLLLDIVPSDAITPFIKGNSLQIIFLSVGMGLIMLTLGKQVEGVFHFVQQVDLILLRAMEYIGGLAPYIVFTCILEMSLDDFSLPGGLLIKIFLLVWIAELVVPFLFTAYLAYRGKISMVHVAKEIFPIYLVALSTASSASVFGANMDCCIHKFGIEEKMANLSVPLMQALLKVGDAISNLVLLMGTAEIFGVPISPAWLLIAFFMSGLLAMATPPVAGGLVASLTILCVQLGMPNEALGTCVALAQLLDFTGSATNVWCNMTGSAIVADSLHLLDKKILQKS
jgi:Na+/H+-dicarboxylate symporter